MSGHSRVPVPQRRPEPRPDHIGQQVRAPDHGGSHLAPNRVPRPQPRPDNLGPRTEGMYPGMGMRDETARFGALGRRQRRGDPSEVVLHQTSAANADSTRRGYDQRIRQGSSIGAHYLIDRDGDTSLTVPTDRVVSHTVGHNNESVGIENVGAATRINRNGDVRAQIEGMELSPDLRERLLAMTDRELRRTLSNNDWHIYPDITGGQKRSNWLLLNRLAEDHDLDLGEDVHAHEHVQAKTIGEGENIEEFVDTMVAWPGRIEELEALVERTRRSGSNPEYLHELETYLSQERARQDAVRRDGTPEEINALDGERLLGQTDGPAHEREGVRDDFYENFYDHMGRLDERLS